MRKLLAEKLYKAMGRDERIFLLTGDLGYGLWDRIRIDYPDRFMNVGSCEQLMIGMAAGMAHKGLRPVVYSITPFAIYRPFEFIRNYIDHEYANVTIIGGGRGRDYGNLGFSHWAEEDKEVMRVFTNIESHWPDTEEELDIAMHHLFSPNSSGPNYINVSKQ